MNYPDAQQVVTLPDLAYCGFGRVRTADPNLRFESESEYDAGPLIFDYKVDGGGSYAHSPYRSSVILTTDNTPGAIAVRQQRGYNRYQAGIAQKFETTQVFGEGDPAVARRCGYGDGRNGIFLEQLGDDFRVVLRSYATGALVETRWSRNAGEWNGSRIAGEFDDVHLNALKAQIFSGDIEWLGVGDCRVGLQLRGKPVAIHQLIHANEIDGVYMSTASLPLRWEIENVGTPANATNNFETICGSVKSEGGVDDLQGYPWSVDTVQAGVACNTETALFAIRPKLTFNSIQNRGVIVPGQLVAAAITQGAKVRLRYGATVEGGSWVSVNDYSITEYNRTMTGFSGGLVIGPPLLLPATGVGSNLVPASGSISVASKLALALDIDGAHPTTPVTDCLLVTAETFTAGSASTVRAALGFRDIY